MECFLAYFDILGFKEFVDNRLIRWDEESESKYQEIRQTLQQQSLPEDQDNSEETQSTSEENIDTLIV